jgi:hypothetical protein
LDPTKSAIVSAIEILQVSAYTGSVRLKIALANGLSNPTLPITYMQDGYSAALRIGMTSLLKPLEFASPEAGLKATKLPLVLPVMTTP